jgi:hypothetical protein
MKRELTATALIRISVAGMQTVSCVNQDPFLFSLLARKEKRFLDSKEKSALERG